MWQKRSKYRLTGLKEEEKYVCLWRKGKATVTLSLYWLPAWSVDVPEGLEAAGSQALAVFARVESVVVLSCFILTIWIHIYKVMIFATTLEGGTRQHLRPDRRVSPLGKYFPFLSTFKGITVYTTYKLNTH